MKNCIIIFAAITVLNLILMPLPGFTYNSSNIEQYLEYNRTLNGNPYRTENEKNIDYSFMIDLIREEIESFNNLIDDYDDPENPSYGYTWDLRIFHPGETPGVLPSGGGPYPIIIICKGATASSAPYMDWLATEYAKKGYVVAIPQFINDSRDELSQLEYKSIEDIRIVIYALQVSQTIDYLEDKFKASGLLNPDETTLIGHSYGGYVSLRAACHERRIARIALLSAYYENYYELNVLDTYDIMRFMNSLPDADKPALHVQRFTQNSSGCPDIEPACDPVPVIDGWLHNLSEDPWEPILCDGSDCEKRTGTFYHYMLYSGQKEDGIRNNIYLTHSGGDIENGYPEVIRFLDNFFTEFPVDLTTENNSVTLVETKTTPGFDPLVFILKPGTDDCPAAVLLDCNQKLNRLRHFRDKVLSKTAMGRTIINLYSSNSPGISRFLNANPVIKNALRPVLKLFVFLIN